MNALNAAPPAAAAAVPTRTIICSDAIAWLQSLPDDGCAAANLAHAVTDAAISPSLTALDASTHVFTSLPDISELPTDLVGGGSVPSTQRAQRYATWFIDAATLLMRKMAPGTYCIFLQSDARMMDKPTAARAPAAGPAPAAGNSGVNQSDSTAATDATDADGLERRDSHLSTAHATADTISSSTPASSQSHVVMWLDKSHLCNQAAQAAGCTLLWHKIVLTTTTIDKRCYGRPSYSHLLCFGKGPVAYPSQSYGTPDVFDRGEMLWARGIGLDCALLAVAFLKAVGGAQRVVDPFCGVGTVLATANVLGLDALGVELSPSRCKKAAGVDVYEALRTMGVGRRSVLGLSRGTQLQREFRVVVAGQTESDKQEPGVGAEGTEGKEAAAEHEVVAGHQRSAVNL